MNEDLVDIIISFTPIEWFVGQDIKQIEKYKHKINYTNFVRQKITPEVLYWLINNHKFDEVSYYEFIIQEVNSDYYNTILPHIIAIIKLGYFNGYTFPFNELFADCLPDFIDWNNLPFDLPSRLIIKYFKYINRQVIFKNFKCDDQLCEFLIKVYGVERVVRNAEIGFSGLTHLVRYPKFWRMYPTISNETMVQLIPYIPNAIIKYLPKYINVDDWLAEQIFDKVDYDCLFRYGSLSFEFLTTHHPTKSIVKNIPLDYEIYVEKINNFIKSDRVLLLDHRGRIIKL